MKTVGITQRVEYVDSYNESRDCLDQRWSVFLLELGLIPIPLPNVEPKNVSSLLDYQSLDFIILSGGNSISILDKKASDISPHRDKFEQALLEEVIPRNIKILGVCRGMQMVNLQLGGSLKRIERHVAVRHDIITIDSKYNFPTNVNSYHEWGIGKNDLASKLRPLVVDDLGNIEAYIDKRKNILGIMWHPEREIPFNSLDKALIKDFFV